MYCILMPWPLSIIWTTTFDGIDGIVGVMSGGYTLRGRRIYVFKTLNLFLIIASHYTSSYPYLRILQLGTITVKHTVTTQ